MKEIKYFFAKYKHQVTFAGASNLIEIILSWG